MLKIYQQEMDVCEEKVAECKSQEWQDQRIQFYEELLSKKEITLEVMDQFRLNVSE